MNEQAGPACALSVLIVGVFAVLLHDRERPPLPAKSAVREGKGAEAGRPAPGPLRETALVAAAPKTVEAPSPARSREPATLKEAAAPGKSETEAARSPRRVVAPISPRTVPRPKPRPRPVGPRSSFTVVEPGETLADVATRVYGSPDAKEAVWKANRDQIVRVDSPLARGMLLRTP